MYARDRRDRHSISHSAPPALTRSRRYARQIVEVKRNGPYGETVASIEALGTVVGGICRYRGPLRTLFSGPRKECRHELLTDAATAMGWVDVNAHQVGHPDRMDIARTDADDSTLDAFTRIRE